MFTTSLINNVGYSCIATTNSKRLIELMSASDLKRLAEGVRERLGEMTELTPDELLIPTLNTQDWIEAVKNR